MSKLGRRATGEGAKAVVFQVEYAMEAVENSMTGAVPLAKPGKLQRQK
uniref:Uncharacterized protein n=1 Tax=Prolemur simus TaxID=1328070 RepID=A0A8C8Z8Q5_PROSS